MTRQPDVRHRFLIQEFAARAGVTVKALHLYDRLGLVIPARSEAGHRIYTSEDFRRVRHIVALKRLGVPLRRVGAILAGHGGPLDAILHHQRRALEDRRDVLDRLIRAIRQVEDAPRNGVLADILDSLVEGLTLHDTIDAMRKYFAAEAWPAARTLYEDWPSDAWRRLYSDVTHALDDNPELHPRSKLAQSFATRWQVLDANESQAPGVCLGLRRAWADRRNWPKELRERFERLGGERAARFVAEALWEQWDAERAGREHATGVRARVSEARRRLYRDGRTLLGHDPSSGPVQDLRARWEAIVDDEVGRDVDLRAEMIRSFKARRQWPAGLVRSMAASYELDAATWSAVADLLEAAHDRSVSRVG
jgi:DNA-binding transcriptional MerR regulator